jgi:hypothetical protein
MEKSLKSLVAVMWVVLSDSRPVKPRRVYPPPTIYVACMLIHEHLKMPLNPSLNKSARSYLSFQPSGGAEPHACGDLAKGKGIGLRDCDVGFQLVRELTSSDAKRRRHVVL